MIRHMNGDVEGTPEELAAYDAAQRKAASRLPATPIPAPWPPDLDDLVHRTRRSVIPWSTGRGQSPCPACAQSGVCGCVLAGPIVMS